ncbi:hypothetical protein S83_006967 [Arachis hypogaea]
MVVQKPKRGKKILKDGVNKNEVETSKVRGQEIESNNRSRFTVLQIEKTSYEELEQQKEKHSNNNKEKEIIGQSRGKERAKNDSSKGARTITANKKGKEVVTDNTKSNQNQSIPAPTEPKAKILTKSTKDTTTIEEPQQIIQWKGECHYEENWMVEENTALTIMEECIESSIQDPHNKGRPPDFMPSEMETEGGGMDPVQKLVEGIDFTTPQISVINDTDMNMD